MKYEDMVYRSIDYTPQPKEWYEIPTETVYFVNCERISQTDVNNLFTKLVNGDGAITEEDILVDEEDIESDNIKAFKILGEYSEIQLDYIDAKLDNFDVDYFK